MRLHLPTHPIMRNVIPRNGIPHIVIPRNIDRAIHLPISNILSFLLAIVMLLAQNLVAQVPNALPTAPQRPPLQKNAEQTSQRESLPRDTTRRDTSWNLVWANMSTSFSLPLQDFGKKPGVFVGSVSYWCPLRAIFPRPNTTSPTNPSTQGLPPENMLAFASATYFPIGYWFVNFSYFQFINRNKVLPWHPDFTYSFGYNDWHDYTFSLIYGNYGGNRFAPNTAAGERVTRFEEGTWSLGFKFPAPRFLRDIAEFDQTSLLQHQLNVNVIPQYFSTQTNRFEQWQTFLSLQTRYNIISHFFGLFTVFYYPSVVQQQPWNPDFTYGFGYADWNSYTFSVQYNNYSGNRFPWNKPADGGSTGNFLDGIFSVSFNITF